MPFTVKQQSEIDLQTKTRVTRFAVYTPGHYSYARKGKIQRPGPLTDVEKKPERAFYSKGIPEMLKESEK